MKQTLRSIPVEEIIPNPDQPRRTFEPEAMESLVESIRERGIIQPIIVREANGSYMIIAGERRWQAAIEAGLREVPAIVADTPEKELLPSAIAENMIREDLNPIEEAEAYRRLADTGWSQDQISRVAGKTRSAVSNTIRILELEDDIRELVRRGELTEGHARALLTIPSERRLTVAREAARKGLSVRAIEAMGRPRSSERRKKKGNPNPELRFIEERIRRSLGVKAEIHGSAKTGKVVIDYYSESDLNKIIGRLYEQ